jgi:hypothetical protein
MLGFLVLWIPTVALPHFLRSNSSLDILHVTEGSSFEHVCLIIDTSGIIVLSFTCAGNNMKVILSSM